MYKISVPLSCEMLEKDAEKFIKTLRSVGAQRVFLSVPTQRFNNEKQKEQISLIKKWVPFLKKQGFETGVWLWTFHFLGKSPFRSVKGIEGAVSKQFICPLDEDYRKFSSEFIKELAASSPDMIMFDDDYRLGHLDVGLGCACDKHLEDISKRLFEDFKFEDLNKVFTSKNLKYRRAWRRSMGDSLESFAREMRLALDSVNPDIRMGLCTCMTTWDIDGTNPCTIARILAGKTKPFMRLIGAAYWQAKDFLGCRIADTIEIERMQLKWCENSGIEIMSEGDVYPRPRFAVPAALLEGLDTAMRADGQINGILKYMLPFTSSLKAEHGYVDAHKKNMPLYEKIHEIFDNKRSVGVRIYEALEKFEETEYPSEFSGYRPVQNGFISYAQRMVCACSLPMCYDNNGYTTVAFGENARSLPETEMKHGVITDIHGAKILKERGIDVGLLSIGEVINSGLEHFEKYDEEVSLSFTEIKACELELDEKAKVESSYQTDGGMLPASYLYTNAQGVTFLVLNIDAYFSNGNAFYRSYPRAWQITETVNKLSQKRLPAVCADNPDLYIMCKEGGGKLAVGLWNFSIDGIDNACVCLNGKCSDICFISGEGKIDGDTVIVKEIQPYAFVGFEVTLAE